EETAERWIRPALRGRFVDLCRKPIADYLERFGFASDVVKAMYAVTDAFTGVAGTWTTPGTGMNFLVHNMCRLPGADGTWMIVQGGMGVVTGELARLAIESGATIATASVVERIVVRSGRAVAVALEDGREIEASVILSNADPFRTRR